MSTAHFCLSLVGLISQILISLYKTGEQAPGIFSGVSGAEIRPHSQWKLGDFFPNLEKKIPNHS